MDWPRARKLLRTDDRRHMERRTHLYHPTLHPEVDRIGYTTGARRERAAATQGFGSTSGRAALTGAAVALVLCGISGSALAQTAGPFAPDPHPPSKAAQHAADAAKSRNRLPTAHTAPLSRATEAQLASAAAWQQCAVTPGATARLACFDQWALDQRKLLAKVQDRAAEGAEAAARTAAATGGTPSGASGKNTGALTASASSGNAAGLRTDLAAALATAQPAVAPDGSLVPPSTASAGIIGVGLEQGCKDRQFSDVSRFWELEAGSSCPTFSLRGYRANTLSVADGSSVNRMPTSLNPVNSATTSVDYQKQELRLHISLRTKLATGLLTPASSNARDSLWVGYSQQSYWQFFNSALSRPFRSTDYEPEVIYVYPTDAQLPFGWRWRYTGAGLVHQSNGQSDPLSRSWNRVYLMTGFERGNEFSLSGRIWQRLHESPEQDNNPDITNYIGHGEVQATWNPDHKNTFVGTVRGTPNGNHGSVRLEWLRSLGDGKGNTFSGLRLHTSLFSGYGDSLIDYNRKRTVFTVGFSLVDF
jgi:phospholipase A1